MFRVDLWARQHPNGAKYLLHLRFRHLWGLVLHDSLEWPYRQRETGQDGMGETSGNGQERADCGVFCFLCRCLLLFEFFLDSQHCFQGFFFWCVVSPFSFLYIKRFFFLLPFVHYTISCSNLSSTLSFNFFPALHLPFCNAAAAKIGTPNFAAGQSYLHILYGRIPECNIRSAIACCGAQLNA